MSDGINRLLTGSAWAFFGRLSSALLGLAVSVLVARLLSPSDMGIYLVAMSIASFISVLSVFGLPITVVKLIACAEAVGDVGKSITVTRLALSCGSVLALLVFSIYCVSLGHFLAIHVFSSYLLDSVVPIVGFLALLLALQSLIAEAYRGFHRIDLAVLAGGLVSGCLLILTLLVVTLSAVDLSLRWVLTVTVISVMMGLICGYPLLRRIFSSSFEARNGQIVELLSTAWPIWLHSVAILALFQGSTWIVAGLATTQEVAAFAAANRLSAVFPMTMGVLYAFLPPFIAELHATGQRKQMERVLRSAAGVASVVMVGPLMMCIVAPGRLLGVVFGDFYSSAGGVLAASAIGNFFSVVTGIRGYILLMCGHERLQLCIAIGGGAIGLLGVYLGLKFAGIQGAALGACVGLMGQAVVELVAVRIKVGIWCYAQLSLEDLRQILKRVRTPS